jgi:hypothetical protein
MAGLFGKRAAEDKTVLIVDIENASVGCALVRLSSGKQPRLFAETRTQLPMFKTTSAAALLRETGIALREALGHTSVTAARMRNHEKLAPVGIITSASVFVSAPWASAHVCGGALSWDIEQALAEITHTAIEDIFGTLPVEFHAASSAAVHMMGRLFEQQPNLLLCFMTGEVTELGIVNNGALAARATIPFGRHFLLRTLQTHSGMSHAEARSALLLARTAETESPGEEALFSAGERFAREFSSAARDIRTITPVQGILVVAEEPTGEWVARQLATSEPLIELFDEGTTVQALHAHHVAPYLAAHAARPDLLFMTEALFVDSQK